MDGHKRQREQSAKMIEAALFELMQEKGFSGITVSEIAGRADVARRTFYRLYKGKEDVLCRYMGKLCQDYGNAYLALEKYDLNRIAEDFFGFWHRHRDFLILMKQCGLDEMIYGEMARVSEEVVKKRIGSGESRTGEDAGLFACYSTGGFLLLLRHWVAEGMEGRPEEYARKVSRAILKIACGIKNS